MHFFAEDQPVRKRIRSTQLDTEDEMLSTQHYPVEASEDHNMLQDADAREGQLVVADVGADEPLAPQTPTAKRPRSADGTPVKERPPIPGIPPEQQALAALMLQTMESVEGNIQTNEKGIKRVEDESRRRHETMMHSNHQIEKSVMETDSKTKQLEQDIQKMKGGHEAHANRYHAEQRNVSGLRLRDRQWSDGRNQSLRRWPSTVSKT